MTAVDPGPDGAGPARLVLATLNQHKVTELARILEGGSVGVQLVSLGEFPGAPDVAETGATFRENALLKAHAIASFTGLPAVADDSGFCVDALNGMPGVLSARWSGKHGDDAGNTALLLAQLRDVPDERRSAAFVSACALVSAAGEVVVRGEWAGVIAREPHGDAGFGYDPVFVPNGEDRTAAQLTSTEKDAASHRGRALNLLLPGLRDLTEAV
jgi:XTP/dITP diphosphohydrolase